MNGIVGNLIDVQTAFLIAQAIGVVTTVVAILCLQLKNMTAILICQLAANTLAAFSYLFNPKGMSGVGISIIAVVQALVMFFYDKKQKRSHWIITALFISAYVGYTIGVAAFEQSFDFFVFLPMLAAVCYALAIVQKKPSLYRIFGMINPIFWIVYDASINQPANVIMHTCILISAISGIIRLDIIGKKKKGSKKLKALK